MTADLTLSLKIIIRELLDLFDTRSHFLFLFICSSYRPGVIDSLVDYEDTTPYHNSMEVLVLVLSISSLFWIQMAKFSLHI